MKNIRFNTVIFALAVGFMVLLRYGLADSEISLQNLTNQIGRLVTSGIILFAVAFALVKTVAERKKSEWGLKFLTTSKDYCYPLSLSLLFAYFAVFILFH